MTSLASEATGLLERTRALIPLLRANQDRTEQARRVVDENIEALSHAGVFKMTVAKRYGGYESSAMEQYDVLSEISRGCPSTGWVATILTAMIWNTGLFPDEAQDEVFADPNVRVASVFAPGGNARPVDGGVVVTGRWPFNTGCQNSQWAILTALVEDDDGEAVPTSLLIPYEELTILDDWDAFGMTGTGSNTTVAEEVFVPSHRMLPVPQQMSLEVPTVQNASNPYFRMPVVSFAIGQAAGAPVGFARGALDVFMERLPGRKLIFMDYPSQAEAPITHLQVGEAVMRVESADAHARRAAALLDELAGQPYPLEVRARIRTHAAYATRLSCEAVDTLFHASGASAIQHTVPIQRYHRDIHALSNHAAMTASTSLELYGRIYCGLEPNTALV